MLPERHVAKALGRELAPAGPRSRRSAASRKARSSRRPRRATRGRAARRRQRSTRPAPSDSAGVAEAHRLLPVERIVGEPEPDLERPGRVLTAVSHRPPPMICSSMPQIIDSTSSRVRTNSGEALIARGSSPQRLARERQAELLLDPPGPRRHHDQPLAEEQRLLDRVGDEHDGRAGLLPEPQHQPLHLLAGQRVERPERLVHQDDLGVVGEAARQRHPLLHAARELLDRRVAEAREPDRAPAAPRPAPRSRPPAAPPSAARSRRCRRPSATRTARPAGTPCRGRRPAPVTGVPPTRTSPGGRRAGTPRGC